MHFLRLYLINHENLSKTSIEALDWINKHKKYHNLVIAVEFFYKNVLVEMKTHLEVLCGGIDIRPSYDLMYSREIVEKNHEKIKNENYQYFYGLYLDSYLSHFINSQIELLFLKFLNYIIKFYSKLFNIFNTTPFNIAFSISKL